MNMYSAFFIPDTLFILEVSFLCDALYIKGLGEAFRQSWISGPFGLALCTFCMNVNVTPPIMAHLTIPLGYLGFE
jgi:hypothetical protein